MITPEVMDVNVSKLLNWGKQFEIKDINDNLVITCYIRLVGDAELNRARVFALRRSGELRKKLKSPDSDERIAYVLDGDFLDRENKIAYITVLKSRDFISEAYKNINLKFPKEPKSDATLEEQEKYQTEVDAYPTKVQNEVRAWLENKTNAERKKLEGFSDDDISKLYEDSVIADLCETEMVTRYKEMCVYFGTYADANYKERFFNSYEEFENLPKFIKDQFLEFYGSLEISIDDLKKLPEVVPS